MKKLKKFALFLLLISLSMQSQENQIKNVDTNEYEIGGFGVNNTTTIKLHEILLDGEKVPISITYDHTGINLTNDFNKNGLGFQWKINDLGVIKTTLRDVNDFFDYGWMGAKDLSSRKDGAPDYFSTFIFNDRNFDFCFDEFNSGLNTSVKNPSLLSNQDGFKVNLAREKSTFNYSFDILDKNGNSFQFIGGPAKLGGGLYNDYYLKSVKSSNSNDYINIDYLPLSKERSLSYVEGATQLNQCIHPVCLYGPKEHSQNVYIAAVNEYYNKNAARFVGDVDYYTKDDILIYNAIYTNNEIINFKYSEDLKFLNRIEIYSKLNNELVKGYEFIYDSSGDYRVLTKIKKFNSTNTDNEIFFEFEYYPDNIGLIELTESERTFDGLSRNSFCDYLQYPKLTYEGYAGGYFWDKVVGSTINPEGNFYPEIEGAKSLALKSIKNKYSGVVEFDYCLNLGSNFTNPFNPQTLQQFYGGGILIESKKCSPLNGNSFLVKYEYDMPEGYLLNLSNPSENFIQIVPKSNPEHNGDTSFKHFLSHPKLSKILSDENYLENNFEQGAYFKYVVEKCYDFNTMKLKSKIKREYIPNYEGIYLKPLLKKETFFNQNDSVTSSFEYCYSYNKIKDFKSSYVKSVMFDGFKPEIILPYTLSIGYNIFYLETFINRVKLEKIIRKDYFNGNALERNVNYEYINAESKIIKKIIKEDSNKTKHIQEFSYCFENQLVDQPFVSDLVEKNIIVPLKTQNFIGDEKISELLNQYDKSESTGNNLMLKSVFKKFGDDQNSKTEKTFSYDEYDIDKKLVQYSTPDGLIVSLIWGYNKSLVVAKIENMKYSDLSQELIQIIQESSSDPNQRNELDNALYRLRQEPSMQNAKITTYTHKPLIGVESITDYKGFRVNFQYDNFGKLVKTTDGENNILFEKKYYFNNK